MPRSLSRSCELSQKFNLFLDISLPEESAGGATISTTDDGILVWKVAPGVGFYKTFLSTLTVAAK
jgi:hypothetical protein